MGAGGPSGSCVGGGGDSAFRRGRGERGEGGLDGPGVKARCNGQWLGQEAAGVALHGGSLRLTAARQRRPGAFLQDCVGVVESTFLDRLARSGRCLRIQAPPPPRPLRSWSSASSGRPKRPSPRDGKAPWFGSSPWRPSPGRWRWGAAASPARRAAPRSRRRSAEPGPVSRIGHLCRLGPSRWLHG